MLRLNVLFLLVSFLTISHQGYAASDAVAARDEATCIYDLVTPKIQESNWRHLTLETRIYFSGPVTGEKAYTIFARSTQNSPENYKIQFRATWVSTPIGRCSFAPAPLTITSSANETVVHYRTVNDHYVTRTELDPSRFPLEAGFVQPATDTFYAERAYVDRVQPGADAAPKEAAVQRNANGDVTLSAETLSRLSTHGLASLVEGGGALALQKYWRPTGRSMQVVRRVGQVGLVADSSYRMYLVVGQGSNPSYVPLYNVTREGAGNLWDLWATGTHIRGVLQLPGNYVSTFYEGNARLSDAALRARLLSRADRPTQIRARLAELRTLLNAEDSRVYRHTRDSQLREVDALERELRTLTNNP